MYYGSMDDVDEILCRCSSRPSLVSVAFFCFSLFKKLTTYPTFFFFDLNSFKRSFCPGVDVFWNFWWLFYSKHVKHRQLSIRSPSLAVCKRLEIDFRRDFCRRSLQRFALLQNRSVFHSIRHRPCLFEDVWSSPCFVREARRASRRQSDF